MKRRIEVTARGTRNNAAVSITATINSDARLSRAETERLRDELASRLLTSCANLPYLATPLSRVRVR